MWRSDLPSTTVLANLNGILSDCLYTKAKMHWNEQNPNFFSQHQQRESQHQSRRRSGWSQGHSSLFQRPSVAFSHSAAVRLFDESPAVQLRFRRLSSSITELKEFWRPGGCWRICSNCTLMILWLFFFSSCFLRTTCTREVVLDVNIIHCLLYCLNSHDAPHYMHRHFNFCPSTMLNLPSKDYLDFCFFVLFCFWKWGLI